MTYQQILPSAFPHMLRTTQSTVRYMVRELISNGRTDTPQGSSFAVTVDNWDGTWNLWMSEASKDYIVSKHPHVAVNIIPVGEMAAE